jgi:RNA polymerase sigma-70 factor, ECF subfamily
MLVTPASLLYRLRQPEDAAAWVRFVDLYTPLMFHWAQRLGQQDWDCSDLVQDVFLILWRKLPEFRYDSEKSFHAWLKTIFLNCYRSRLRKLVGANFDSRLAHESCFSTPDFSDRLAEDDDTRYLIRQAYRLIETEFSTLQQQVFREYVLNEEAPEKVGAKFGIRIGTVYGIKSKILNRLREELRQILD